MKICHRCDQAWLEPSPPAFNNTCSRCGMPLHACANCRYFISRGNIRCLVPDAPRVLNAKEGNQCRSFDFADTRAGGGGATAREEAKGREAWDQLFQG